MIFVKGYGQMCNNILQHAHAYAFGREYGVSVVAMRFAYKYRYFHICDTKWHIPPVYWFAKFLIKTGLIKCLSIEHHESITAKDEELLRTSRLIGIDDWGFRYKDLFLKYRADIARLYAFRTGVVAKSKVWLASLDKGCMRLGVHIRRGDYARFMGGRYFFTDDVYIEKIKQFMSLHPDRQVQVFISTNDKKLDIEKFRKELGTEEVYLSRGNPAQDLYVLSECHYLIGPKSTFSLMASFYHDIPLCWLEEKDMVITHNAFDKFENLFMEA